MAVTLMQLDPDAISAGDLADLQEHTGHTLKSIVAAFEDLAETPPGELPDIDGSTLLGIIFLSGRQADPGFTFEDARNYKLTEIASAMRPKPGRNTPAKAPLKPLQPAARSRARKSA